MAGNEMNPKLPSHFYETISNPPDHPIRISTLFMKRYGESLGDFVILTAGGTEWKVWLKKINDGTWFEKGWRGFVEFYSIKEDYLVAFKYLGDGRFLVIIFDETCNEIVYPGDPHIELVPVKVESDENGIVLVGNGGNVKPNLGMSCTVVNGRRLRKRVSSKVTDASCGAKSNANANANPAPVPQSSSLWDEQRKIWELEREFKSKNPFFACAMRPSFISNTFSAGMPVKFLREHFGANETKEGVKFSLRLSGEKKKWPVVLKSYRSNGTMRGLGWKQFARAKELKVGQFCIFELIKKEKVFVFHMFD